MASLTWKTTAAGNRYPYVVDYVGGKPKWISLSAYRQKVAGNPHKITTEREARKWFSNYNRRHGRALMISGDTDLTSFFREYQRETESTKSTTTQVVDRRRLAVLESWLSGQGVSKIGDINARHVDRFREWT